MSKGKVKITQEQADIIEVLKDDLDLKHLIKKDRCMDWAYPHLNGLSDKELAIALYVDSGYEVEPEYKTGDTLINTTTGRVFTLYRIGADLENDMLDTGCGFNEYRHATPEEKAAEKERGFFAKNGREIWELKGNDILVHKEKGTIATFTRQIINPTKNKYTGVVELRVNPMWSLSDQTYCRNVSMAAIKKYWKIACFAEDRKDVN